MSDATSPQRKAGDATRRRVLGDAHVDRSRADPDAWEAPFIDLITDAAWGHTWSRGTLPLRERSLITLALLAGLGNFEEFELHLRATANTGATREDVLDVLLHVAIYAGVPRANHAIKLAKTIYEEMEAKT
ncbi:4-carboxymuconolactone decarboxylase [Frigidibacter sp. ROC022]|uniref:4-carboxymuconolactone decarboxylase n=1 Tax=Frigidibacter sp. ROC022 TaxID=2971796 RepID=UPI00215B094F|nr:4-carboxymuconolactone decarboxylase [Frigidibacter sp. ROC022]MCR8722799.1 4-carboxymuconolactone decarboxylase [Frigidibacter sp. ROC022]